ADAVLPGGMAPTDEVGIFLVSVGGIVDQQLGVGGKVEHVAVKFAGLVLGVGDVGHRSSAEFNAKPGGATGMIQGGGANDNSFARLQDGAGAEVAQLDVGAEGLDPNRKQLR